MLSTPPDEQEKGCISCSAPLRFSIPHALLYSCILLVLYFLPIVYFRDALTLAPVIAWTLIASAGLWIMYAYLVPIKVLAPVETSLTFYKSPIFWVVIPLSLVSLCIVIAR